MGARDKTEAGPGAEGRQAALRCEQRLAQQDLSCWWPLSLNPEVGPEELLWTYSHIWMVSPFRISVHNTHLQAP